MSRSYDKTPSARQKISTTIVRKKVATSESVCRIPHFAKIEVSPAKIAEKDRQKESTSTVISFYGSVAEGTKARRHEGIEGTKARDTSFYDPLFPFAIQKPPFSGRGVLCKDTLYQHHVENGAAGDTQQIVPFPKMHQNHSKDSNRFKANHRDRKALSFSASSKQ